MNICSFLQVVAFLAQESAIDIIDPARYVRVASEHSKRVQVGNKLKLS